MVAGECGAKHLLHGHILFAQTALARMILAHLESCAIP